jgi:hypothetical protein
MRAGRMPVKQGVMIMNTHPELVTVETSCGETFQVATDKMTDRQLTCLLRENADRSDVDPRQIAAMRSELLRRMPGSE